LPCVSATGLDLIRTLIIIAIILLIVIGLIDLPIQTMLFLREQRMSKTEYKREMKEEEGAPEFVSHRKEQHRTFAAGGGGTGIRGMTLIFTSSEHVVGIRYDSKTDPVPIIVVKGAGANGDSILQSAQIMGVPVEPDPFVANELSRVGIGGMVPERLFNPVAMALVRHAKAG
jgi:type III secretion protein U